MCSAESTSTSSRSSQAPKARRAASSTPRAAWSSHWSRCWSPSGDGSTTPAAARPGCSCNRWSSSAYARVAGWRRQEPYRVHSDVYEGTGLPEIIIPRTEHLGDYASVVAALVETFAEVVEQDVLTTYRDLVTADRDVIRIRTIDRDHSGSPPVSGGGPFHLPGMAAPAQRRGRNLCATARVGCMAVGSSQERHHMMPCRSEAQPRWSRRHRHARRTERVRATSSGTASPRVDGRLYSGHAPNSALVPSGSFRVH